MVGPSLLNSMYESVLCRPQDAWTLTFCKNCSGKGNVPTRDSSREGIPWHISLFPQWPPGPGRNHCLLRTAVITLQVKVTPRGSEPQTVGEQEGASMLSM